MLLEIVLLIPAIWILVYFWWTRNYNYWEKKGVPHIKPSFPYGNVKDLMSFKQNIGHFAKNIYDQFPNDGLVGFYSFQEPMLVVRDPELIKNIFIKDFNSFGITGLKFFESVDPLISLNPIGLKGDKWKVTRGFLNQALSPAKLKTMVPTIAKSSQNFVNHIRKQNQKEIQVRQLMRYFTLDSVAYCGFGAECNSFEDPSNSFASETVDGVFSNTSAILSSQFAPWMNLITRSRFISPILEAFFVHLGPTLTQHREKNNITHNDLIQILMAHNAKNVSEGKKPLRATEMAAVMAAMFLDGTETVSVVMSFALHQIAYHQNVQDKLREEIEKNGSSIEDFDHDKVNSMEYLDMIIQETLRTHPIVYVLSRKCLIDTQLGGHQIEKGTRIIIPLTGLYSDPKHFPEPEKFIPERFSKEGREKFHKSAFLPFGDGPKMCAGQKFANLEMKIGIVNLVKNFKITLQPSRNYTNKVIPNETSPLIYFPKEDTYMKFEPL